MIREILVLHHAHTDIGYTHAPPVAWALHRQFIDDALECIECAADWEELSRPVWTCETTGPLSHWLRYASVPHIERFRHAVEAGAIGAGALPLNFSPMPGVPQWLRALSPVAELRRRLGLPLKVAIQHDVNGLPWTVVPLLLDAGIEMLVMGINIWYGGYPLTRPLFFRWRGPDGRSILTLNGEQYGNFQRFARLIQGSTAAMAEGLGAYLAHLTDIRYPHDFVCLTMTRPDYWDNNPPWPAAFELVRRWNSEGRRPAIRFVTPEGLLARAKALTKLPEANGDWTDFWNFGAASSARETSLAQAARAGMWAADLLAWRAHPRDPAAVPLADRAYERLNLWDEHTWGSWASVSAPDHDDVAAGWHLKAQTAYETHALSRYLLTEHFEALAGNPRHAAHLEGLLVFNPSAFARRDYIAVPQTLLEERYEHCSSTAHELPRPFAQWIPADQRDKVWVGPLDVPAYGFVRLRRAALAGAAPADLLHVTDDALESPFHRVAFDRKSGQITVLTDTTTGFDYVDGAAEWPFAALVHETVETDTSGVHQGREAMLNFDPERMQEDSWVREWPARRTAETPLAHRVLKQPHRIGLEWQGVLPGTAGVTRRIWLQAHKPEIELDIEIRKNDVRTPEAIYLALPLNLPDWEAVFDTAGTPTRYDTEQLAGSCRDWVTVSSWVDLHTAAQGFTLACPDAPLVQIGGFNFGRRLLRVDHRAPPLCLGWLTNNYWNTNFRASQPGVLRFHYVCATHRRFDAVEAARVGQQAKLPLLWHPVVGENGTRQDPLVAVEGHGVIVAACRTMADIRVAWLQNLLEQPVAVALRVPGHVLRDASLCDAFGEPRSALPVADGAVRLTTPGRSVTGVRLQVAGEERSS